MSSILERYQAEAATNREAALDQLQTFGEQISRDVDPGKAAITAALEAAGVSFPYLDGIVRDYKPRPGWRADEADGEKAEREITSARSEISRADEVLREAQRQHQETVAEINSRISVAQSRVSKGNEGWRKLRALEHCPDPRLVAEVKAVRSRIESVKDRLARLTVSTFDQENTKPSLLKDLHELTDRESELIAQIPSL